MEIKKIFIFGAGVTGLSAYKFCKSRNIEVAVWDNNSASLNLIEKSDIKENMEGFDILLLSPGIPLSHPFVQKAIKGNIKIISDIELYKNFTFNKTKIVTITGTNGKSTTSSLLYHILQTLGKQVALAGNIGISPLTEKALVAETCIMEVSSFQSEITNFMFDAAVLLNITPDHIDYHLTLENYIRAKEKIIKNSYFSVIGIDSPLSLEVYEGLNTVKDSIIPISIKKKLEKGYSLIKGKIFRNLDAIASNLAFENLPGEHNLENILACIVICLEFYKLELFEVLGSIKTFKGLPHRIEILGNYEGVEFINDSKATNADATLTALKTFAGRPIFLIAGGISKKEGIEVLLKRKEFDKVKEVILIGSASGEFTKSIVEHNKAFSGRTINYLISGTLEKAVKAAFISAKKVKNSIVLLSPLCASFDQFKDYNERGECFRKVFETLKTDRYIKEIRVS